MASDRLVSSQHVLRAVMELERRGSQRVIAELETIEPELSEYILESLGALHHQLADNGLSSADTRSRHRQAEAIVLVGVMSLRKAHHDLWRDEVEPPAGNSPG